MGLILRDENGMHFWREWTKIIRSQKFTKLVNIQAPMKNKYSFFALFDQKFLFFAALAF